MPKKGAKTIARKGLLSHSEIKRITKPAFVLSVIASVITLFFAVWASIGVAQHDDIVFRFFMVLLIAMQYFTALLMIVSAFLIKTEHHVLAGSILLLCASTAGLVALSGMFIGPALGILGGIVGIREYEKMIKHV